MRGWLIFILVLVVCAQVQASTNITSFGHDGLVGWEEKSMSGVNSSQIEIYKERPSLRVVSDNAASGWILKKRIDLLETPYMDWAWATRQLLPPMDETSRSGDDYVARIYIIIETGMFPWQIICLNYVWSSSQGRGELWDSAVAGSNVKMVSVTGDDALVDQWHDEQRNVYNDLITYFGDQGSPEKNEKRYRYIDLIAIMTDTDNSGTSAESFYGDIIFSSEESAPLAE